MAHRPPSGLPTADSADDTALTALGPSEGPSSLESDRLRPVDALVGDPGRGTHSTKTSPWPFVVRFRFGAAWRIEDDSVRAQVRRPVEHGGDASRLVAGRCVAGHDRHDFEWGATIHRWIPCLYGAREESGSHGRWRAYSEVGRTVESILPKSCLFLDLTACGVDLRCPTRTSAPPPAICLQRSERKRSRRI